MPTVGLPSTVFAILVCAGVLSACDPAPPPILKGIWEGIYTDAQAKRGENVYAEHCVQCHAEDLSGDTPYNPSPTLAGKSFQLRWENKTMSDLFALARVQMPKDKPASLKPKEYADVLAFLLKANEFPSGETDLPGDARALTQVKIVRHQFVP